MNKDWNKRDESFTDSFKRGYVKERDKRRSLLEEGYKKAPVSMTVMEGAGAPVGRSVINEFTNWGVKKIKNLLEDY